jgi:hypothetical protein
VAGGKDGPLYESQADLPAPAPDVEIQPTGPQGFAIGPDGSFFIADTVGNRILQYGRDAKPQKQIDLRGKVEALADVEVTSPGISALDLGPDVPAVFFVSQNGRDQKTFTLPEAIHDQITGLHVTKDKGIQLDLVHGAQYVDFLPPQQDPLNQPGIQPFRPPDLGQEDEEKRVYKPHVSNDPNQDPSGGEVDISGRKVPVRVENVLGSLEVLGFDRAGGFYTLAEEVAVVNDTIQVDQKVLHFDENGTFLNAARVPIQNQYTYVPNNVALDPNGDLYALITHPDHLEITKLAFVRQLPQLLPPATAEPFVQATAVPGCTISRKQIETNAFAFRNNLVTLTEQNIRGACSDRGIPSYLSAPGTYRSVPYDWGGGDSVDDFNNFMKQDFQAGDVPANRSSGTESCSKGVDCSGFVSRCWQLPGKFGTTGLPGVSTKLGSTRNLKLGDILNKPGSHVRLFSHVDENGMVWAWESTTDGGRDRVVYRPLRWAAYQGFQPMRLNKLCDP